jgi:phosphoglycerate dehydrogenase-like enzyme
MPTVLIVPGVLFHQPGPHVDLLRAAGFEIRYPRRPEMSTEAETIDALAGIDATIAGSEPYNDRVLAASPALRVVSRAGVGVDRIDIDTVTRHGVVVAITPAGNHESVAEHTMAMILSLARSLVPQNRTVREGHWTRVPLVPLRGRTLGLVGLGRIGRSVAVRAAAFGMNLVACEQVPDLQFARRHAIDLVNMDTLLPRSDFVSLHVPLTDQTRGLIDRTALARMKPGSFLVNTARGGLVVESDLLAALQSGRLGGAGLDVFAQEPTPADNPLLKLENVLVTPHMGGVDTQSNADMAVQSAQNIIDLFNGVWPEGCVVNSAVKQAWHRATRVSGCSRAGV